VTGLTNVYAQGQNRTLPNDRFSATRRRDE